MNIGLRNPALIATAIASTPQGQKAIGQMIDKANQTTTSSLGVVKDVLKISLLLGVSYWAYKKFVNNFSKMPPVKNARPATISDNLAMSRAETIYKAMYGVGNGFDVVLRSVSDLKINDFVKVYNAFGNRSGLNPLGKKMNMIEWFQDEYKGSELIRLRFELSAPGAPNFF